MTVKCFIGLHDWDGFRCKRCGKTREHQWGDRSCKCVNCEETREHDWDGCRCKRCFMARDESHESHIWVGCKCRKCGKTRDHGHSWDGNICRKCGRDAIGVSTMTQAQIVKYLRDIAALAEDPSSAPLHLNSYEKRRAIARLIGQELNKRGGFNLMKDTLMKDLGWCPGCRNIEMYWDGIGSWAG